MKYKAAILGYYGFGNLGDELLLTACLDMFARCNVERDALVVLSNDPAETSRSFGVDAVNRWKFREVVKALRTSQTLLLGGGGLFQDTTSLRSSVYYWGVVRLAKYLGCRVWALGQSVGPLRSGLSRLLAGDSLRLCSAVHVRDESSCTLAEALGCMNVIKGSDLVLTLKADAVPSRKRSYMLVNLRPCDELDAFVRVIAPQLEGRNVVGAALSDSDVDALGGLGLREIVRVRTFNDAAELWAGAYQAVGMRLHFGVLSRIFGTPLALLPYDAKVTGFAEQSGVPCIIDKWCEPVMPLPVRECVAKIDAVCREMLAL